jgi:ketosteroid isomerase-like protein
MTTHDYFASTEDRRAWLHCSMTSTRHGGSYENEYMFVLSFDEAGEKITKIVEMVDSQRVREAWANVSEVEFKRD